jgi:hypothetical protein
MKKIFLLFFILFFLIVSAPAQVRFGLKSGLNISTFYGDDTEGLDSKLGFVGGFFISYQSKNLFILQPEVSYTTKGATAKIESVNFTLAYDYVEIPILFKFEFPLDDNPSIKPAVFAGPFVSYKTKAKIIVSANGKMEEDGINSVAPRDYGFQIGGALGLNLGKYELGFDVRYIHGITSVDTSVNSFDIKNRVINLNVYFCFTNMK